MKVKEHYYEDEVIHEVRESLNSIRAPHVKKASNRLYCYMLKRHYKAESVVIDYEKKIAYLQFGHSLNNVVDDRLLVASARIVEIHYSNLRDLLMTCIRKNEGSMDVYNQVLGIPAINKKQILTSKN